MNSNSFSSLKMQFAFNALTPVDSDFVEFCVQKDPEVKCGFDGKEFSNWF